jgi:hypothetical protein
MILRWKINAEKSRAMESISHLLLGTAALLEKVPAEPPLHGNKALPTS